MINVPTIYDPFPAAPEVDVIPSFFPIPGLGILAVNAFVLKAKEPLLVDTGLTSLTDDFMKRLAAVIDPLELKWLWLTHCHFDHIGSLWRVLDAAPNLRVITTFLGVGIMSLARSLPMERVYLLNPGQALSLGDRNITAYRPPTFDSPETTGFYDAKSNAFFSADCFGALLSDPAQSASEVAPDKLRDGLITWSTVDAPWVHIVDRKAFQDRLGEVRSMAPKYILSNHLPAAEGLTDTLLGYMAEVPNAKAFVGPDQAALEKTLAGMKEA